jgi:flagellar hook-associated protein 1 FlgK
MSDLLGIGASGVRAYGAALAAVGNNVSNADTPGYTRRQVTLEQNTSANATQLYYTNKVQFGGVVTANVTRAWDDYQAAAARTATSEAGEAGAKSTWLSNAETALNDTSTGVGQSATAFFNAGDTLASDPSNTGNRQAFLAALDQTAEAFRTTAGALAQTSSGIATAAQTSVQTVNSDLDALDKVNASLRNAVSGSSSQADLEDQRDRLIDDLSSQVGVNVSLDSSGAASVTLASSGLQLTGSINGNGAGARLTMAVGSTGTLSMQAVTNGSSQPVSNLGGTLGGLVSSAQTVSDRRASLDKMASDFVAAVNGWNASGTTAAGAAGSPLLSGSSAATIASATSDPAAIAARESNAGTANGNLLSLSALRGGSGLEQTWSAMVTDQGQIVSAANSASTAASTAKDSALSARDTSSGVDLDSEAADMIRYQQAYNGAAKVIQVAQETMQSILDLF